MASVRLILGNALLVLGPVTAGAAVAAGAPVWAGVSWFAATLGGAATLLYDWDAHTLRR